MKRLYFFGIALILLMFPLSINAQKFLIDNIYYSITSANNMEVMVTHDFGSGLGNVNSSNDLYNKGYSGIVNIPAFVNYNNRTYAVTSIDSYAFGGYISGTSVTSVTIPETVTNIGEYAFANCKSLETVKGGENIVNIEDNAFYHCTALSSFPFGENLTSIGSESFKYSNIKKAVFGSSLTQIGRDAFENCLELTTVVLGENLTYFTASTTIFYGCSALKNVFCRSLKCPSNILYAFTHTSPTFYVPSSEEYGFGVDYLTFPETSFNYKGQSYPVVYFNDVPGYNCFISNAETEKNAGNHTLMLNASYSGDVDFYVNIPYNYIINPAPLKVTVNNETMNYGDPVPEFSCEAYGLVNGETISDIGLIQYRCTATRLTDVGTYPINVEIYAQNYNITYQYGKLTIEPAPLTVSVDNAERVYGEENPQFNLNFQGFVNSENEYNLASLPKASTTATPKSDVGKYNISITGGYDKNYSFYYENGTLTITPATLIVSANNASRFWGEENPSFSLSYKGFRNNDNENDLLRRPYAWTSATIDSMEGNYPIYVEGGEAKNYDFEYIEGILTILPADEYVEIIKGENLVISIENNTIHLLNKKPDAICYLFDLNGQLIRKTCDSEINYIEKGIYVIKIGNITRKIVI